MERSLDPAVIAIALGEHAGLPSPSAFSELMAQAELGLLQQEPQFDDNLRRNAWYLHAIGSSKFALRTYGIARQRATFQVAAHIFDLYLQSKNLDALEKLKYVFASQIAYTRSELAPNALAIFNRTRVELNPSISLAENPQEAVLTSAVSSWE